MNGNKIYNHLMIDGKYNIKKYNNLFKRYKMHVYKSKKHGNKEEKKYYNSIKKDNQNNKMLKLFNIYKFN